MRYSVLKTGTALVLLIYLSACTPDSGNRSVPEQEDTLAGHIDSLRTGDDSLSIAPFPYRLDNPDKEYKLPGKLVEVSGLSYLPDGLIAMVEDENGRIYLFDEAEEDVVERYTFGPDGDYEGIAVWEDTAYVLRSDGVIFAASPYRQDDPPVVKWKTELNEGNDAEGLVYLPGQHALLIACKASPNTRNTRYSRSRAVYRFDLQQKRLLPRAFLRIDLGALKERMDEDRVTRFAREFAGLLDPKGDRRFQPSGIAIHPITGDYYLLASVGKALMVLDSNKRVTYFQPLDRKRLPQPEGICFSPEGTLYISSEGKGGKARLLRFAYRP